MNRKALILSAFLSLLFFATTAQQVGKVTPSGIGYLEYLPEGYHGSSADYPVVISLHGIKEKGTSSTNPQQVLRDLPRVANVGLPKYVKSGKKYPFILISPQLKSQYGSWPASFVIEVLNHVKRTLRIDEKRIYLTGLSLGGYGVWKTAGAYPEVFAAIAPICAGGNALENANAIAKEDVATWGFHGDADKIVSYTVTTRMVNAINAAPSKPSPLAKVTIFPRMGHIIWDKAYHETNVIAWMLTFRNGSSGGGLPAEHNTSDENQPPVVNAGADKTITLPANSLVIKGKASDGDGKITRYEWAQVSGGRTTLSGTTSPDLQLSNLAEGVYVFKLTAQDDDGATAADEVRVHVEASANKKPVVDAGDDKTITLPSNTVILTGSASDTDGKIASVRWTQLSGSNARTSGSNSTTLTLSDLAAGTYVFRLSAEDNDGSVDTDDVTVTVKQGASENTPPLASAGGDHALTLPHNATELRGSGRDEDGSVVSYQWTQVAGQPVNINGQAASRAQLSNLKEGSYVFRLTVKDDQGASAHDDVRVTVSKPSTANSPGNGKTADDESQEILPQTSPGPDRNNGEGIEYLPIVDKPWMAGR